MDSVAGEFPALLKMVLALIFVLGLMGALALVLKKLGLSGRVQSEGGKARLKMIESLPIDSKRRLVLLQRDDVQHLVILGTNSETVVETGITSADNT